MTMFQLGDRVVLKRDGAGIYDGFNQEYEVIGVNTTGTGTYTIVNENHQWWCFENQLDPAYVLPEIEMTPDGIVSILGVV